MLKILSTFSLLIFCFTSYIHSKPSFKIETLKDKSFILHLESQETVAVNVKLRDGKGLILVEEEINDTLSISKKYNLNLLPSGDYTLVIEDHASICRLPVALEGDKLHIDVGNQKEIAKPIFLVHESSVDVILVISEKTNAEMYIYDDGGNTIYDKKGKYSKSLRRRFDLSKLESGTYTMSIIVGDVVVKNDYYIRNGVIKPRK